MVSDPIFTPRVSHVDLRWYNPPNPTPVGCDRLGETFRLSRRPFSTRRRLEQVTRDDFRTSSRAIPGSTTSEEISTHRRSSKVACLCSDATLP